MSEAPEGVVEVAEVAETPGINYAVVGEAPTDEKKKSDMEDTLNEFDSVAEEILDPDSGIIKKSSKRKEVKDTIDDFNEVRKALENDEISSAEAVDRLNDIIDSVPEGTGDESDFLETLRDYMIDYRRILDGTFYQRQQGKNLPPIDSSRGYSKNGVFITPGMRVRDKWGFAGVIDRYNKTGWVNVYVIRDIGSPNKKPGEKYYQSKGTQHLTVIPEGGDDRPWAYIAGMNLSKLPENWRELATPGEIEQIEQAMADAKGTGTKSSIKKIAPSAPEAPEAAKTAETGETNSVADIADAIQSIASGDKEQMKDLIKAYTASNGLSASDVSQLKSILGVDDDDGGGGGGGVEPPAPGPTDDGGNDGTLRIPRSETRDITADLFSNARSDIPAVRNLFPADTDYANPPKLEKPLSQLSDKQLSLLRESVDRVSASSPSSTFDSIKRTLDEEMSKRGGGGKVTEAEAAAAANRVNDDIRDSGNEGYDSATSPSFLQALSDDMKLAGPDDKYLTIKLDYEVMINVEDAKILLNYYLGEPYLPKGKAPKGAPEAPEAPVEKVEESDVNAVDIDPQWQVMPASKSPDERHEQFIDYYKEFQFSIDPFFNEDVTDEQERASYGMIAYQAEDYFIINRLLRNQITVDEDAYGDEDVIDPVEYKATIEKIYSMDMVYKNAPTIPEDMVLYRGIHSNYSNKLMQSYEVGDLFEDLAYSSATTSLEAAEGWSSSHDADFVPSAPGDKPPGLILEIVAPAGTRGIYLPAYLGGNVDHSDEVEVLLDRGTTFRVIAKIEDADGNTRVMRVVVVDQTKKPIDPNEPWSAPEEKIAEPDAPEVADTAAADKKRSDMLKKFGITGDFADRVRSISYTNDETGEEESSPIITYAGRPIVVVDVNGIDIPFYVSTGSGGKENVPTGKWYPIFGLDKDTGWFNKGGNEDVIANYYDVPSLRAAAEWLDENVGDIRKSGKGVIPSIDKEANNYLGRVPDPLALTAINKDVQGGLMGSNEALATRVQTIDRLMELESPIEDAEAQKTEVSKRYFWEEDDNFFKFNNAVLDDDVLPLIETLVREGQYEKAGEVAGRLIKAMSLAPSTTAIKKALKNAYDILDPSQGSNVFFGETLNVGIGVDSSPESRASILDAYSKGYSSVVDDGSLPEYVTVTPTGRPPVRPDSEKPISASSFKGIKSLTAAVKSLAKREEGNNRVHEGAAVDGGDIEDLYVRVNSVVSYSGNLEDVPERKIRLRFRLTAWAGSDQATAIDKLLAPVWEAGDWEMTPQIVVKPYEVLDNGDLVERANDYPLGEYNEDGDEIARTYRRALDMSNGDVALISFTRTIPSDTVDSSDVGYTNVVTLNNYVTIDLPADATEEDITNALRAAGVRDPRAATEDDAKVVIENRLISVFGKGRTKNPSNNLFDADRERALDDIKEEWGIGPEDIELSLDSSGFIVYKAPEEIASKIAKRTNTGTLNHMMNTGSIEWYLQRTNAYNFNGATPDQRARLVLNVLADVLFGTKGESGLKSAFHRYSEGKDVKGMSSDSDFTSGGADYVFLTPQSGGNSVHRVFPSDQKVHFYFNPEKAYRRLDFYANRMDRFGRRIDHTDVISEANAGGYEVMFKHGISIEDSFGVLVNFQHREVLLQIAKERNITEIAGMPIERFLTTRFYPSLAKIENDSEYYLAHLNRRVEDGDMGAPVGAMNIIDTINSLFSGSDSPRPVFADIKETLKEGNFAEEEINSAVVVGVTPDLYLVVRDSRGSLFKVGMLHKSYGQSKVTAFSDLGDDATENALAQIVNSADREKHRYNEFEFNISDNPLESDITPIVFADDRSLLYYFQRYTTVLDALAEDQNEEREQYVKIQLIKFLTMLALSGTPSRTRTEKLDAAIDMAKLKDLKLDNTVTEWLNSLGYTSNGN